MINNQQIHQLTIESLRDWFKKEKWVRISTSGNIAGPCGTSKNKKNPDRCLPRAKAQSLTKAQRAATARKKKKAGAKGKTVVKNTKKATVKKEQLELPSSALTRINSDIKNAKTMAQSILQYIDAVDDKESPAIFQNPKLKRALELLKDLGDDEVKDEINEYVLGSRHGTLFMKFKDLEAELEKISNEGDFVVRRESNPSDKVHHQWEIVPIGDADNSKEEKSGITVYDYKFPFDPAEIKTDEPHSFSVGGEDRMNTLSILKHLFGPEAKSYSDVNMNDVDPDAWVKSPYGKSENKEIPESRYEKIRDYYKKIDQIKQSSQKEYEKRKEAEKIKNKKTNETANPQDGKSAPFGSGFKKVNEMTIEDIKNLTVGLLHEIQGKEVLMEKDDRCTRIAKRKYDTWPSAYASGAVVRCRRGEIWKGQK